MDEIQDGDENDENDEDEETLQLQLQEIQARLKLRKLQKKARQTSDTDNEHNRAGSAPPARANSAATDRAQSRISDLREERARLQRSKSQASIHVPVSPVRWTQPAEASRSPGRVLLGIDKGLKGSDISLKRAPSLRKPPDNLKGPYLHRVGSQASARNRFTASSESLQQRTQTFSERLTAMKAHDVGREEKALRIKKTRSTAFDIDHQKIQHFKEIAVELPPAPRATPEFSRDQVLSAFNKPSINVPRSKTVPNLQSAARETSNTNSSNGTSNRSESQATVNTVSRKSAFCKTNTKPNEVTELEASQFEPYSSVHLSKRIVPHNELTRIVTGKKTFTVPDLLRDVKAPDFSGPDIDEDVVVFAVIASKTDPKAHESNEKNLERGKFMIMTLTDLKWELDLFLFNSAFDKFWKLTPGTIIAILNPGFMPPKRGQEATGKFSLTLHSDADTILEVGTARDLDFCKSIRKDGKSCDSWVDKRHTEFCNFHVNMTLEKTHSKRAEVNTMNFGKGRGAGERKFYSRDTVGGSDRRYKGNEDGKTKYDRASHSQIYIGNRSTANMLDDVDFDPDAFHRGSTKEDRLNRRILEREKERELRKKLGVQGNGLGADYMRKEDSSKVESSRNSMSEAEPPPNATTLGLLAGKGKHVQLSPIKRKRTNTVSSSAAVGWGGKLTKELGRMKNGESLQPPVKKKTRFVTEKGIREAGRESIGGEAVKAVFNDLDDDDDDLDIIRE